MSNELDAMKERHFKSLLHKVENGCPATKEFLRGIGLAESGALYLQTIDAVTDALEILDKQSNEEPKCY